MTHPNEEIARTLWKEFEAGNFQEVFDRGYADDVVVHLNGRHRYSGDIKGRQAFMDMLGATFAQFPNQQMELHDVLANDQHVIMLFNFRWERDGRVLEGQTMAVYHVNREGMATEVWMIDEDPESVTEFIESFPAD